MGEYANYRGQRIKIGTCEDMYYLRASQAGMVGFESGNVNPRSVEDQKSIRFRFPWPDEDHIEPGGFDAYDRSVAVPDPTIKAPEGVEHYSVQFSAHAGYLLSLPCPESEDGRKFAKREGCQIHRNGFAGAVKIVQQAYRNGHLALILTCGGCGSRWNLPTWEDAEPIVVACRAEADRAARESNRRDPGAQSGRETWWHTIADRIAEGYGVTVLA